MIILDSFAHAIMLNFFLEPRVGGGVVRLFAEMVVGRIKVHKVFGRAPGMAHSGTATGVRRVRGMAHCSRAESGLEPRISFKPRISGLRKLKSVLVLVGGAQRLGNRIEPGCSAGGVGAAGVCGRGSENRVQVVAISYSAVSKVAGVFAGMCGAVGPLVHLAFNVVHARQGPAGAGGRPFRRKRHFEPELFVKWVQVAGIVL